MFLSLTQSSKTDPQLHFSNTLLMLKLKESVTVWENSSEMRLRLFSCLSKFPMTLTSTMLWLTAASAQDFACLKIQAKISTCNGLVTSTLKISYSSTNFKRPITFPVQPSSVWKIFSGRTSTDSESNSQKNTTSRRWATCYHKSFLNSKRKDHLSSSSVSFIF
jgi:hypothetical protein